ncbi:unnamed protein product [Cuscuta campestris]|uniref:Uncharacterized protein n=1 Tax=Cuscuta campestris TaxID=132261 RepID=A0A484LMW1_9ASTE|nr:unnamed protein product [Cuscuta campestris]
MVLSMEAQWSNKTVAERERTPQWHEVSLRAEAYRCFFDAATSISEESISFGCVLFDPGGAFVAAANGGKLGPLDPLLAEALACKETLSWLRNRGETRHDPTRHSSSDDEETTQVATRHPNSGMLTSDNEFH